MEETDNNPLAANLEDMLQARMSSDREKSLEVYMDNQPTTLEEALKRCVQERTVYMPDYVLDENGVLKQLRFDRVDLR